MQQEIERVCLDLCPAEVRGGVRFVGPRNRTNSKRLRVENMDGVDLSVLCARLRPCAVFLREAKGGDHPSVSRVDIYFPKGSSLHLFLISRTCYVVAAIALCLAFFIVAKRTASP